MKMSFTYLVALGSLALSTTSIAQTSSWANINNLKNGTPTATTNSSYAAAKFGATAANGKFISAKSSVATPSISKAYVSTTATNIDSRRTVKALPKPKTVYYPAGTNPNKRGIVKSLPKPTDIPYPPVVRTLPKPTDIPYPSVVKTLPRVPLVNTTKDAKPTVNRTLTKP